MINLYRYNAVKKKFYDLENFNITCEDFVNGLYAAKINGKYYMGGGDVQTALATKSPELIASLFLEVFIQMKEFGIERADYWKMTLKEFLSLSIVQSILNGEVDKKGEVSLDTYMQTCDND